MKIVIIGDGSVGQALGINMDVMPLGPGKSQVKADVVVICVPTETVEGKQDLTQVKQAISRIKEAKLIILRSTVLPGTTDALEDDIPLMFIPEFGFEATMVDDLAKPQFYIVGVTEKSKTFTNLIPAVLPKAPIYHVIRAKSAEFAKYFTNIWGSAQVILANSYYDWVMAETGDGAIYDEAIEAARAFPNLPQWGWKIYDQGFRGYGGKCLPKDTQAAVSQYAHPLWLTMEDLNKELRGTHENSL